MQEGSLATPGCVTFSKRLGFSVLFGCGVGYSRALPRGAGSPVSGTQKARSPEPGVRRGARVSGPLLLDRAGDRAQPCRAGQVGGGRHCTHFADVETEAQRGVYAWNPTAGRTGVSALPLAYDSPSEGRNRNLPREAPEGGGGHQASGRPAPLTLSEGGGCFSPPAVCSRLVAAVGTGAGQATRKGEGRGLASANGPGARCVIGGHSLKGQECPSRPARDSRR